MQTPTLIEWQIAADKRAYIHRGRASSRRLLASRVAQSYAGRHARERVLRATLEVLADYGLPGFTIEAVARRAVASKATLYRRWAPRASLLVEAMDTLASHQFPVPATGHLRTDLLELLSRQHALLSERRFPRLMAAFIDAAERDPALQRLHVKVTESQREPASHVLLEARQRGDIPFTADVDLAIDLLVGTAFYRRFIAHQPLHDAYDAAGVDHVLIDLGAGPQVRH